MNSLILVFIGGGMGCLTRYGVAVSVARHFPNAYPVATFISNTLSCLLLLGILMYISADTGQSKWVRPLLITGFCGGFSTFSTFSFETAQLMKNGNPWVAAANIAISVGVCVWIMYRLGR